MWTDEKVKWKWTTNAHRLFQIKIPWWNRKSECKPYTVVLSKNACTCWKHDSREKDAKGIFLQQLRSEQSFLWFRSQRRNLIFLWISFSSINWAWCTTERYWLVQSNRYTRVWIKILYFGMFVLLIKSRIKLKALNFLQAFEK